MSHIDYKKPNSSDALRLSILFKTVYIQAYAKQGISFEFANFITDLFSLEKIEKNLQNKVYDFIVAYYDNNPIGVSLIKHENICPIRKIQTSEIDKLYVLESFYGKGIGKRLITKSENEIQKKGYQNINLEVYAKNERAIAFYKKSGYKTIGTVDFYIEDSNYENLVMTKAIL